VLLTLGQLPQAAGLVVCGPPIRNDQSLAAGLRRRLLTVPGGHWHASLRPVYVPPLLFREARPSLFCMRSKDDLRNYRGARVKRTLVTASYRMYFC
jgi:hypothetical protein